VKRTNFFALSAVALRAAGIQVVTVSRAAFHPHVVASGVIKPDAQAREATARKALERAKRLVDLNAMSRAERDLGRPEADSVAAEADAARQDLLRLGVDPESAGWSGGGRAAFSVAAPLAGVVLERSVSPGLLPARSQPLRPVAIHGHDAGAGRIVGQGRRGSMVTSWLGESPVRSIVEPFG